MTRLGDKYVRTELNMQGANNLLAAAFKFLRSNNISEKAILDFTRQYCARPSAHGKSREYSQLQSLNERMGILMATWFSEPRFLDVSGNPIPLTTGRGVKSLGHLIRISRARIQLSTALQLMSQSPSIKLDRNGRLVALRRVFVLPELEVPRAAFIVERFLNTLERNALSRKKNAVLLLERSCHVSEVNLSLIAPLLRDIEGRGTAFMDSIDGEIEEQRQHREKRKPTGEMGVMVFAWTKPAGCKRKTANKLLLEKNY